MVAPSSIGVAPARIADLLPLAGRSNNVWIGTKQLQTAPSEASPPVLWPGAAVTSSRLQRGGEIRAETRRYRRCPSQVLTCTKHAPPPSVVDVSTASRDWSHARVSSLESRVTFPSPPPRRQFLYPRPSQIRQACRTGARAFRCLLASLRCAASPLRRPSVFPTSSLYMYCVLTAPRFVSLERPTRRRRDPGPRTEPFTRDCTCYPTPKPAVVTPPNSSWPHTRCDATMQQSTVSHDSS
jgi:hypothetical protein